MSSKQLHSPKDDSGVGIKDDGTTESAVTEVAPKQPLKITDLPCEIIVEILKQSDSVSSIAAARQSCRYINGCYNENRLIDVTVVKRHIPPKLMSLSIALAELQDFFPQLRPDGTVAPSLGIRDFDFETYRTYPAGFETRLNTLGPRLLDRMLRNHRLGTDMVASEIYPTRNYHRLRWALTGVLVAAVLAPPSTTSRGAAPGPPSKDNIQLHEDLLRETCIAIVSAIGNPWEQERLYHSSVSYSEARFPFSPAWTSAIRGAWLPSGRASGDGVDMMGSDYKWLRRAKNDILIQLGGEIMAISGSETG